MVTIEPGGRRAEGSAPIQELIDTLQTNARRGLASLEPYEAYLVRLDQVAHLLRNQWVTRSLVHERRAMNRQRHEFETAARLLTVPPPPRPAPVDLDQLLMVARAQERSYCEARFLGQSDRPGDPACEHSVALSSVPYAPDPGLAREEALQAVAELVSRPGFGSSEPHQAALVQAVQHALALGVAAADEELLDWLDGAGHYLKGEPALKPVLAALGQRHRKSAGPLPPGPVPECLPSPDEDQAYRDQIARVKRYTQGENACFVSFVMKPEHRKNLIEVLGFREVTWPKLNPSRYTAERLKQLILASNASILFVTRYRKHHTTAGLREWCAQQGVLMVELVAGYSVRQCVQHLDAALGLRAPLRLTASLKQPASRKQPASLKPGASLQRVA